jgi:glycosyltransferase involved in cell wall biosynthesis
MNFAELEAWCGRRLSPSVVGAMEDELLRKVQLTVVTHENLRPRRAAFCSNTVCIPNGADVGQFREAAQARTGEPPDLWAIPRPRFGFVGHLHYWIDLKLIRYLAERRRQWSFILIGPTSPMARLQEVKDLPNIHLLGRKSRDAIPYYLAAMDCCLNPYITGLLADHVSPLKLYEYLAAGKPVVSTEMPEARKFSDSVRVADSYDAFLRHCEAVLAGLPEEETKVRQRIEMAAEHSWENRFQTLNRCLDSVLPA